MAGVDVMTARDQLGHANIGTTLSIYTHLSQKYKEKNIDKLNEYLDKISNLWLAFYLQITGILIHLEAFKAISRSDMNIYKQACRGVLSLFISIFQKLSQNIDFRRNDEK